MAADASPAAAPLAFGETLDEVRWARLDEAGYAAASFLDERLLEDPRVERWVTPWRDAELAAEGLGDEADFIFHLGHVGSTLLSRILGRSPAVFSLREPEALRRLAVGEAASLARLGPLLRLYARTWRPEQRALVKATSFVAEIGGAILERMASARAIMLVTASEPWLAGILGGPAARAELPRLAPARADRLRRRIGDVAAPASPGEMAAAGWASEALAVAAIADAFGERVMRLDFDAFLLDPRAGLKAALSHLRRPAGAGDLSPLLASPDMGRYAKAPEHPFSAAMRGQVLRAARVEQAGEIARGLRWLEAARARSHALDRAAAFVEGRAA